MDVASKRGFISNIIGRERRCCEDYLKPSDAMNAFSDDIQEKLFAHFE
jgi:hypothetical protein